MADKSCADGGLRELALFAGAGGGVLGGKLLGWRTVCAVETDPYAASVLLARQNDGLLPPFPIWDDVCTFDGRPWRGVVDVVSGGFPCQDISAAGSGKGIEGERSGLWVEMARIINEVRPRYAFVENSPVLTSRGLGTVLGDLAAMGFDARWGVLGAADVGAHHQRDRIWIVAHANCNGVEERLRQDREPCAGKGCESGLEARGSCEDVADTACHRRKQGRAKPEGRQGRLETGERRASVPDTDGYEHEGAPHAWRGQRQGAGGEIVWGDWAAEPDVGRVAHGVAARVDRLRCLGNGQVPQCAAEAWRLLSGLGD